MHLGDGATAGGDTSGRDAVTHLGPGFLDHIIDGLHHAVDIVTTPVTEGQRRS